MDLTDLTDLTSVVPNYAKMQSGCSHGASFRDKVHNSVAFKFVANCDKMQFVDSKNVE